MGNELGKLVAKHEAHIPVLNEDLAIPYALPTGGVFIPMSPITGDLPIYSIPQIILNAGMDSKDYQDCIYEINETSISRYSNLRCVIERLKYDLATFDLYYQRIENLIIDVEDKCFELNNKILKKYNLVFLPFMDILRDDNNTQHFGIIIDMLNRNKIEKKMNKIRKQNIRKIRKNNNNNKKNIRNNNNKNSNKTEKEGKKEDSGIVKPSLFGCFKFLSHTNSKSSQKVISKLSRTDGISSESSDCTENDNNDKNDTNDKIDANNTNNNNNHNNNNNNNNNNDSNEMTPSGVSMALPSPCSSPDSETKYMNNKSNGNNEIVICECKEDVDDSGTIEIENKMSYVGSNATKFGLHIYLPKHLRCDA